MLRERKETNSIPVKRVLKLIREDISEGFPAGSDRWDNRIFVSLPAGESVTAPLGSLSELPMTQQPLERFKYNALGQDARLYKIGAQVVSANENNQVGEA